MQLCVMLYNYRRPTDLRRCLTALSVQSYPPNKVILISRPYDPDRDTIVSEFGSRLEIEKIEVPLSYGPMQYYNIALQKATGDVLALTHDDAEPHVDWLFSIAQSYNNPKVGGVGGREIFPGYENVKITSNNNIGKVFWWGRITGNHHYFDDGIKSVDFLTGANCSYKIDLLHEVGGFDEDLCWQRDSCWYWDLSVGLRIKRAGYSLTYNSKAVVNHFPGDLFTGKGSGYWKKVGSCKAKNETSVMLRYYYKNPLQKFSYILWGILVGTTDTYGLLQFLRYLPKEHVLAWRKFVDSLLGRYQGVVQ